MSNDETFPGTITTIDQNTHRPITWTVLAAWTRTGGYTHTLTIQRPTGRKAYIMNVQMVDGAIAKHDRAESLMGRF